MYKFKLILLRIFNNIIFRKSIKVYNIDMGTNVNDIVSIYYYGDASAIISDRDLSLLYTYGDTSKDFKLLESYLNGIGIYKTDKKIDLIEKYKRNNFPTLDIITAADIANHNKKLDDINRSLLHILLVIIFILIIIYLYTMKDR